MPTADDVALREAAIKTARAVVPEDIDHPLYSEIVTSLASLIAIGVSQERLRREPVEPMAPTDEPSKPPLRIVREGS